MTIRQAIYALCFLAASFCVAVVGIASIKHHQQKPVINFSAERYADFEDKIGVAFGYEVVESLHATKCKRSLWLAYNGESWNDSYCYAAFNHILIQIRDK